MKKTQLWCSLCVCKCLHGLTLWTQTVFYTHIQPPSLRRTITHRSAPSIIRLRLCLENKVNLVQRHKTITPALSQILQLSVWLPVKVSQVSDVSPLSPPPPRLTVMLAGYRCRPVVLQLEMCSPRLSLLGNCDRLISPHANSPEEEVEEILGWKLFQLLLSASSNNWNQMHTNKMCNLGNCFIENSDEIL